MDNTDVVTKQRKDRNRANNPMRGSNHSSLTLQKQSDAAIRRKQQYKKALDSQHHVTMDEFLNSPSVNEHIKTLVKEEIDRYIKQETMPVRIPPNIWL